MKITAISLYQAPIAFSGQPYRLSGGRSYGALDTTLVRIDTDQDVSGWGEICPWGRSYLPEFAEGARTALQVMMPDLIGLNPCNPSAVNAAMDQLLMGHLYAKAAIDIACWDVFGKASGQPVHALLGGQQSARIPLLCSLYNGPPDDMTTRVAAARERGIKSFSAKASGDVTRDIEAFAALAGCRLPDETFILDANGGWSVPTALSVLQTVDGMGFLVEQPCATITECVRVKRRLVSPMILDESAVTSDDLMRIVTEDAADALHVKISRVGGITRARMFRDFCAVANLPTFWEASGGSALADAAAANVALSAPPGMPHKFWSCQEFHTNTFCTGGPAFANGAVTLSDRPGLGVDVDASQLTLVLDLS